jgi:hypothetical protein
LTPISKDYTCKRVVIGNSFETGKEMGRVERVLPTQLSPNHPIVTAVPRK